MKNSIYLRRHNKVILEKGKNKLKKEYISSFLKNIENLGFTFDKELIAIVKTLSIEDLTSFYGNTVKTLKEMVGANVKFEPMYPNFPKQVMDASDAELYINAIMHYLGDWIGARIMPVYEKKERYPLMDRVDLKVIRLGTEEDFLNIFKNLVSAKTSISKTDKEDVEWFVTHYKSKIETLIPDEIPYKENLVYVTKLFLKHTGTDTILKCANLLSSYKTATDVLRLAVAMSDGDVSLATNSKFIKFKRSQRRLLLGLLDKCKNAIEDMNRFKTMWIRLGEILHPFEYEHRYKKSFYAFKKIRNEKIKTFYTKVESLLDDNKMVKVSELLKARPGDFARRLDQILRGAKGTDTIIENFKTISEKISTPVLLQVMKHFKHRSDGGDIRVIFPKGNVAKVRTIDAVDDKIQKKTCSRVESICKRTLQKRFSKLPSLGKVYLDPALENYIVPFSQRSASKALHTIVRGSKIPMEEGKDTVRFFIWWKNISDDDYDGRVDIDLSSVMFDKDWGYKEHISYTNLRSNTYIAYHSGDITSAPDGACEFIDIDIPSVLKYGGRYVVMNIFSFTEQPFVTIPECFAGWMMREKPRSGEIFEAKTVENKFDLTADTRLCIPLIMDLQERVVYWADIAVKSNSRHYNNVEGNTGSISLMGKAITSMKKVNLHELFSIHAKARGTVVEKKEKANTIFSVSEGTTPFHIEEIMAKYL